MFSMNVRVQRIRVDDDRLYQKGSPFYIAAERAGRAAVKHVHGELIREDLIDSGALYNSIDYEVYRSGKGLSIAVGPFKGSANTRRYARYVHDGTQGPIETKPPGGAMPIRLKGGILIFRTKVNGQPAKPYLTTAMKRLNPDDFAR